MGIKYYAVVKGKNKKPTIYDDWKSCKKAITGMSKVKYKGFEDLESAKDYISKHSGCKAPIMKINHTVKKQKNLKNHRKICPICKKPHNSRTKCCVICNNKKNDLETSIAKLLYLKDKYKTDDVFKLIESTPYLVFEKSDKSVRFQIKKEALQIDLQSNQYVKWNGNSPLFIKDLFTKYPTREFLTLSGEKMDPNIHYRCKACDEENLSKYKDFSIGHGCESSKSSGEIVVEYFLRIGIHT